MKLCKNDIIDYYYNSYVKADGLWFLKVEEKYGFDKALEIDNEVWKILPKIQARFLKDRLDLKEGIQSLYECLEAKLELDNFNYNISKAGESLEVMIFRCPWHNLMQKSGRESLSGKIGSLICNTEYSVLAKEFGAGIKLKISERICHGSSKCKLTFTS